MNESTARDILNQVAEPVGTYPVRDAAMRRVRARRRRHMVAVPAGAAAVVLLIFTLVPSLRDRVPQPVAGLPAALAPVGPATHLVSDDPPGPVTLAFSGGPLFVHNGLSRVGVFGPAGYRLTEPVVTASAVATGAGLLVAPDGETLVADRPIVAAGTDHCTYNIVDFVTGRQRAVQLADQQLCRRSVALTWTPDAASVVVAETDSAGSWRALQTFDPDTGESDHLVDVEATGVGVGVAFSRDGRRYAYQIGDLLVLRDIAGYTLAQITLPAGARLAGRGAWRADGSAVAVLLPSTSPESPSWTLRFVELATAALGPATNLPAVTDAMTVRVLGWTPQGGALAVVFRPATGAARRGASVFGWTGPDDVRQVDVVVAEPGAAVARIVVSGDPDYQTIDVAAG